MDCKEIFANMQDSFQPEAGVGVEAVYQFSISGPGGGEWNATITGGNCNVREGTADSPDCTVITDTDTWIAIFGKKINAMSAFMEGSLKIKGNMSLAMKLESMFLK